MVKPFFCYLVPNLSYKGVWVSVNSTWADYTAFCDIDPYMHLVSVLSIPVSLFLLNISVLVMD